DIETTGFSGDYASLYLIGCTFFRDGCWNLIQWFADTRQAEPELLDSFFRFLKDFRILVHFNGDGFDIPFLLKRCRHFKKPYDFSAVESVDIYKKIKPYRRLLGLESLKQKAVEQFLGVSRTDQYSGGQLIDVYHEYLSSRRKELYDLLILHNEDDLKGMPMILPILNYPDFLEHPFRLADQRILTETFPDGRRRHLLELSCDSDYPVPVPFSAAAAPVSCRAEGRRLTMTVELFEGTLKLFYANYKDYYYLIHEDRAVHKTIGELVSRDARVRATAKTCYTRQSGVFLPQFGTVWEPALRQDPKDRISYVSLADVCLQDPACFRSYLNQLLSCLNAKDKKRT
ncbi:MAG: ribonuclease H-like domain-containing protein, partial [Eubacteriales bacterium]|nr:ribonuclease H-like domain-containing protein [Eubacteriales bacterium]